MIRQFTTQDMDAILQIWLAASIKAHSFIAPEFWQSQLDNMQNIYLPASEVYVYEQNAAVNGFYALYENNLAAIFVAPDCQGNGIGKQLIAHAKQQRAELTLSVYKENEASYRFYLAQGFNVSTEQQDIHTGQQEYKMFFRK